MSKAIRILLISDTHSFLDTSIQPYAQSADEVWHAGDIGKIDVLDKLAKWNSNVKAVYGNIDDHILRVSCPLYHFFTIGKHRVLMIHIAGALGKYNVKTRALIQEYNPTLLVCGHSHILKVKKDHRYNLLYMNPGAAGNHGFHKVRTLLRFNLLPDKMEALEVIELGKRGRLKP